MIFFLLQMSFCLSLLAQPQKAETQQATHEIPVLCYHQIRDWRATDSKFAKTYILSPEKFTAEMKLLADSGYHTITPDELLNYLDKQNSLPSKPVLLTFDDGTASQVVNAVPVLKQYNFSATFFIMTVSLNKTAYMSTQQVKTLSEEGFIIGCHTWDHHSVTGYANDDWTIQLKKPKHQLEQITRKSVDFFAYPNGVWNEAAIEQLKNYNYKAAFALADKHSASNPNYTIKRIIVDGNWNANQFFYAIKHSFK